MPQPVHFYNTSTGHITPRVDETGLIILSPTTSITAIISGTLAVAGTIGVSGTVSVAGIVGISGTVSLTTTTVYPITSNSVTGSAFTVTSSVVTLAAANLNRKSLIISNFGSNKLFLGETTTVAASGAETGILVPSQGTYSDSGYGCYTGVMYGIYDTATTAHNVSVRDRS